MRGLVVILLAVVFSSNAFSASSYQSGKISNLTAVTGGIMIRIDSGMPDNCAGTPYGWLLIKQQYTALTSVVLASWVSGNTSGTVYTSGRENGNGYCIVNQFDPAG